MKFGFFCKRKDKAEKVVIKNRNLWKGILLVVLFSIFSVLCALCPRISLASSQEGLPPPQMDKVFGPRCPPGMCVIPQGFLLSRRDKAFSVYFLDEKTGWIVGDNGLALTTTDSGASWQRLEISAEDTFNDVFFIEEKGWIVCSSGLILHTIDGGKTWKRQRESAQQTSTETKMSEDGTCPYVGGPAGSLMKIFFLNKEKGFAVGAKGTILRTMNSGLTWDDVSLDCMEILPEELMMNGIISIGLYDVFFMNEGSGWVVGDSGAVFHSEDGGKEWRLVNIGLLPPLFSIAFKNENEGWAVGQNGFSLKTDDGGESWGKVVIDKECSFYSIRIHENYGVIVGDQATIIVTRDGGNTWARVKTDLKPPYPWLTDTWIVPSNPAKVLSVGKGIILTSNLARIFHGLVSK